MIEVPLDEAYIEWLYSQVGSVRLKHTSHTHWNLIRQLFTKEYVWFVPNDDNRMEDGRNLRHEFVNDLSLTLVDRDWMDLGCSFLEMLIGLSRRLAFEAGGKPRDWFWHFIRTLDLDIYADDIVIPEKTVSDAMDRVIWRTYHRDGSGGLFPLQHAREDQRNVEIWHQLSNWLLENEIY